MKPSAGKAFQPLLPDLQGSRLKAEMGCWRFDSNNPVSTGLFLTFFTSSLPHVLGKPLSQLYCEECSSILGTGYLSAT
ncbi:hypothetical protein [Kamptonema sp. UHCC 0994]|uniref:hypothetical protein n=1 Tax=Kamptonema sp. UHCC 0994 TaxID=3031329 RepID=UPI0023BAD63D|nr:hypothetical protein [Kamptonema sp. UHCC 0994]